METEIRKLIFLLEAENRDRVKEMNNLDNDDHHRAIVWHAYNNTVTFIKRLNRILHKKG